MGLFNRNRKQETVRRDVVLQLIKLGMEETDAADRDIDSPEFDKAKQNYDRVLATATRAEKKAAFDALGRHGYI